jgi:hypothetical protein
MISDSLNNKQTSHERNGNRQQATSNEGNGSKQQATGNRQASHEEKQQIIY